MDTLVWKIICFVIITNPDFNYAEPGEYLLT